MTAIKAQGGREIEVQTQDDGTLCVTVYNADGEAIEWCEVDSQDEANEAVEAYEAQAREDREEQRIERYNDLSDTATDWLREDGDDKADSYALETVASLIMEGRAKEILHALKAAGFDIYPRNGNE